MLIVIFFKRNLRLNTTYLVIFAIWAFLVTAISGIYYQRTMTRLISDRFKELSIVTTDTVNAISIWRNERQADAILIAENQFLSKTFEKLVIDNNSGKSKREIDNWLKSLQKSYGYHSSLLDLKQQLIAQCDSLEPKLGPEVKKFSVESLHTGKVLLSDLHMGTYFRSVHMDLVIPIYNLSNGKKTPVGTLILRIDPRKHLYPLISFWPTPSKTAESILIRKDGKDVLYLSNPRNQQLANLLTRLSINEQRLNDTLNTGKPSPIFQTKDHNGTPVFMVVQKVPDSPWFLISKINRDEVLSQANQNAWLIGLLCATLIFASGLIIWNLWRRESLRLQREIAGRDIQEVFLKKQIACLTEYANDGILLYDKSLKIVDANARALTMYGYTKDQITELKLEDLQSPAERLDINEKHKLIMELDGLIYETQHKNENGETFPVEISGRILEVDGEIFFQSIIRDISERKHAEKVLRKSEQKYLRLFENTVFGVFRASAENKLISANTAFAKMFGYDSPDELIGSVIDIGADLYASASRQSEILQFMLDNPGSEVFENEYRRKDGSTFVGKLHLWRVNDQKGNIFSIEGLIEDITEQRLAAERISRSEEKFRSVFENAHDAIFLIAEDSRYVDCNSASLEMFRCSREEILFRNPQTFSPNFQPDGKVSTEKFEAIIKTVLSGQPQHFEWLHQRTDGTQFDAVVVLNRCVIDGNPVILAIVRDISERVSSERKLRQSEARFRELSDLLPEVVFEADLSGKLTFANKDAFLKFGYAEDELENNVLLRQLIAPEDHERLNLGIQEAASGTIIGHYGVEFAALRKDGIKVPVIVYAKPIFQEGLPVGIRGLVVDITERKAYENQIKAQTAQLRAIVDNLPFDFWAIDPSGKYFQQNNQSKKIWGGLSGKHLKKLLQRVKLQNCGWTTTRVHSPERF